ncbi:MAG TPA: MurT ligase domain-containing protein, partial [Candidatus Acidoferrales bacterium]|nr:MurT ligase domain-containing protein [Candidatus Acidoferrales bacterium]
FEIDEASLPAAVDELRPKAVLVGNLFRDQLDRYGELETTALTIQSALGRLPAGSRAVLNADDPRVGEIGLQLRERPLWYGLEDPRVGSDRLPHAADATTCPRCGERLRFTTVYLGHEGVYACPNGDFQRPAPEIGATEIELEGLERVRLQAGGSRLELPLGGLYNAYNLVAAFAVGRALGLDPGYMAGRLRDASAAFGRQERVSHDGKNLVLMLSKNPAGFNESLRAALELGSARHLLLALNDRIADGRDVSWIWDVDFEQLQGRAQKVIPSGVRAHDLALRLKYAGVPAEPPRPDLGAALDRLLEAVPVGGTGFALCTYTALLDLRADLARRGWVRPYWVT